MGIEIKLSYEGFLARCMAIPLVLDIGTANLFLEHLGTGVQQAKTDLTRFDRVKNLNMAVAFSAGGDGGIKSPERKVLSTKRYYDSQIYPVYDGGALLPSGGFDCCERRSQRARARTCKDPKRASLN